MKEQGKIAWTSLEEIVKQYGCSLTEALNHSASIIKVMETQKINRCTMNEISKNYKLEEFEVMKKLGQGQFGNVLLVTDSSKQNYYALKCISKQQTIKTRL